MQYLNFDKKQLVNLEYSLTRENLRSNRAGSYTCTTLSGCNTRKYHGTLVAKMDHLDGDKHVLVSSVDVTAIQRGAEFNLGIREYPGGVFEPKGHKYIRGFEVDSIPKVIYGVGGIKLSLERIMIANDTRVLMKYTLIDAHSQTTLRFKPVLAFRSVHTLTHRNDTASQEYDTVENGISTTMYDAYPKVALQLSKENNFIFNPDWIYNVEYRKEKERGFEFNEDLYTPGYFEVDIAKGESIIVACGIGDIPTSDLDDQFKKEQAKRKARLNFDDCLSNAAEQFIVNRKNSTDIIAGYPWYSGETTQTFVALPGLITKKKQYKLYQSILDTQVDKLKDGLFPKHWGIGKLIYNSLDASLYFFTALQNLSDMKDISGQIWRRYGTAMKSILNSFKAGTDHNIKMDPSGLLKGGDGSIALTWMSADIDGKPVTARAGYPVEVQALWYNAIFYTTKLALEAGERDFYDEWQPVLKTVQESFIDRFWDENRGYLADCINLDGSVDWNVRPNMVIAVSPKYSIVPKNITKSVLSVAKRELLTPMGLRSLSPKELFYQGECTGDHNKRSFAMHQGSIHPWLIAPFITSYLKIHKRGGLSFAKSLLEKFDGEMVRHCIGSISEVYNGNTPYAPSGAISQAWSVGMVLYAKRFIEKFEEEYSEE